MSVQVTSDSAVESAAFNDSTATQAGITTKATTKATTDASRREPAASATRAAQFPCQSLTEKPKNMEQTRQLVIGALRHERDFPIPGINFIDILPIFRSPAIFGSLLEVLAHQIEEAFPSNKPEVIVGLEARGFLFGPSLALRLGAAFVPVRKAGKMPGACLTETFIKEYGEDKFQIQADGIQEGQRVLIVDDIVATGGSAIAAGRLVGQCKGNLLGYLFMIEITSSNLKGRAKLQEEFGDKPILTLVEEKEAE